MITLQLDKKKLNEIKMYKSAIHINVNISVHNFKPEQFQDFKYLNV